MTDPTPTAQPPAPAPASDGEREDPIRDALRRAEMSISGGLCYFGAEAKHAQLRDAQRRLEDLRAALEARPPAPAAVPVAVAVDGWLPINTAPKDGTEILASDYDAIDIVSWENPPEEPPGWIDRYDQYMYPAWWKPLGDHPPLPQPPQGGEVG